MVDCSIILSTGFLILFIAISAISIGTTAWLYPSTSGGLQVYQVGNNKVSFCEAYPYTYLRPIRFTWNTDGQATTNCGWSVGVTSYRIAAAIVTIVMTFAYILALCGTEWLLLLLPYELVFYIFLSVLWFTVSVVDITTLCNAALSCTDLADNLNKYFNFAQSTGSLKCDLAIYGVTVAVDLAIAIIVTIRCITAIYYGSSTGKSTTTASTSNGPAKESSIREVQVTTTSKSANSSSRAQAVSPKSFNESPSWMTSVDDA